MSIFDWVERDGDDHRPNANGQREFLGSGFVVAPGWVLSAAHVVAEAVEPRVVWRGQELIPLEPPLCVPAARGADRPFAWPTRPPEDPTPNQDAPCVPITSRVPAPGSKVWAVGTTTLRSGRPEPYASWLTVADPGAAGQPGFMRLQQGQLWFGMSGGPVLDASAGAVCGISKAQQGKVLSDLGGWAVPIADALAVALPEVEQGNAAYHGKTLEAQRARRSVYGGLPKKVLTPVPGQGRGRGAARRPPRRTRHRAAADDARRAGARVGRAEALRPRPSRPRRGRVRDEGQPGARPRADGLRARRVPPARRPDAGVVGRRAGGRGAAPGGGRQAPPHRARVHRRDHDGPVLLRPAFEGRPNEVRAIAGPFSGQVGAARPAARHGRGDLRRDPAEERGARAGLGERRREASAGREGGAPRQPVLRLRIDAPPDAEQLRALVDLFGGMRFLIARRGLVLPANIDNVLLDLLPEVDPDAEESALAFSGQLDDRLEA